MSNYHHTQIARLEDISHPPLIVNPTNNIRKHVQGYTQGSGKFSAETRQRQTGPIVMGGAKYETYGTQQPTAYYTQPAVKEEGCMQKCCACLGKVLCCMCICDMLT